VSSVAPSCPIGSWSGNAPVHLGAVLSDRSACTHRCRRQLGGLAWPGPAPQWFRCRARWERSAPS